MSDIAFGFQAAPASEVHKSDQALYREVMDDCALCDRLAALGFNYFMVSSATPGTPIELRQRMMTRFAEEVCPRYSTAMRARQAA